MNDKRNYPGTASPDRNMVRLFDPWSIELVKTDRGAGRYRKRKKIQPELYPLVDSEDDALFLWEL